MTIKVNAKVIGIKEGKVKKGDNIGKSYYMMDAYVDGEMLKSFIPEEKVPKVMEHLGTDTYPEITYNLNLKTQRLDFKDIH